MVSGNFIIPRVCLHEPSPQNIIPICTRAYCPFLQLTLDRRPSSSTQPLFERLPPSLNTLVSSHKGYVRLLSSIRACSLKKSAFVFLHQLDSIANALGNTLQALLVLFSFDYTISRCFLFLQVNTLRVNPPILLDTHLQIAFQGTVDPVLEG